MPEQLTLNFLESLFKLPNQSKTVKLKPRDGQSLANLVEYSNKYIRSSKENYTRIEFPFDGYYYVIAKLGNGDGK